MTAMENDTEVVVDTPTEDTSIRSGLEAAFAETPSAETSTPKVAPAKPSATSPTEAESSSVKAQTTPVEAAAVNEPAIEPLPVERAIPERLKAKFGEKWQGLPPEIRDTFHEYESNIGRLANRYGRDAKAWNDAQATFAPYAEMVRSEGGDFNGALSNLLETARILRQGSAEQKIVLLRQTAQMFNVPLAALTGQPAADGTPYRQIDEATINRLNQLERESLTNRGVQTHNAHQQVNQDLETFTSDPANIYIHEPGYMETMAMLIKAGKAEGLKDAYAQAAWLHERPRQLENARQNQQRFEQSRQAADRAKRASSSVNGSSPGAVRLNSGKLTLRDTLSAAFDGELD